MDKLAIFIATGFGSGKSKKAPGTMGSLVAIFIAYIIIADWGIAGLNALFLFSITIGSWAAHRYQAVTGTHDAPEVVIDEFAGQFIAIYPSVYFLGAANVHIGYYIAAFAFFRLFDIWKPWPIRRLERLPGALGVMADDILAGIMAGIVTGYVAQYYGSMTCMNLATGC